ncbi:hypothetical protein GCM10010498_53300 [Streptomyces cavourensis]|nr:hypothetical protein GCM10010498_53300 [Streptomyces cavourensis]
MPGEGLHDPDLAGEPFHGLGVAVRVDLQAGPAPEDQLDRHDAIGIAWSGLQILGSVDLTHVARVHSPQKPEPPCDHLRRHSPFPCVFARPCEHTTPHGGMPRLTTRAAPQPREQRTREFNRKQQ